MNVLGIESSCDETGIAICNPTQGLIAQRIYSQIADHARYGGVVPELASRDHIRKTLPLIEAVLADAKLGIGDIDAIAYTSGPGLIGALLVGSTIGQSLAWTLDIPSIGINHMEGHLLAPLLEKPAPEFPFIALLVSGGHTMLVDVAGIGRYRILGQSVDDAAGEAFDKTAKILGLPYPGGPEISRLATQGDPQRFHFPRPMTNRPGLDFSFSGLKTFASNCLLNHEAETTDPKQLHADIARAFEDAVVDTMVIKCRRALEATGRKTLIMAGGVSANRALRQRMETELARQGAQVFYPAPELCTDNGAMIAFAGMLRLEAGESSPIDTRPRARWSLEELNAI